MPIQNFSSTILRKSGKFDLRKKKLSNSFDKIETKKKKNEFFFLLSRLAKLIKLFVLVLAMPLVYFGILYLTHAQMHGALDLNNLTQVYQSLMDPFYKFLFLSKICNIWTQDLVHLCLIPIWTSLWFIANAES